MIVTLDLLGAKGLFVSRVRFETEQLLQHVVTVLLNDPVNED